MDFAARIYGRCNHAWFRLLLVAVLCLTMVHGLAAEPAPVSPEKIQRAIEKAREWLIREQEANGSWEC